MDSELEEAMRAAEKAIGNPMDAFFQRIADRVGSRANAEAVFGDPVQQDGVTVVPVAKVRWGFGGGAGSGGDSKGDGEGAGGGGGVMASPAGYIELKGGGAQFVRIRDAASLWPLVLAGGFSGWLLLRGLRSLVRR
jgi:uncharacterized spore protein YtfJ